MIRVGLMGYGQAGQAVAAVLRDDPRFALTWVLRRAGGDAPACVPGSDIPVLALDSTTFDDCIAERPVDALVDFSRPEALRQYGEAVRREGLTLVSAISAYDDAALAYARDLGKDTRVLCSPNVTVGINFLILAARLLRGIAPMADIEIVEQHFRDKPEVSGTARRIAETLSLEDERITSLRLGGIVGHHEVIFGFPYQTVRLVHDSIRREAFGTGVAFALHELVQLAPGFYSFDDLLMNKVRAQLLSP